MRVIFSDERRRNSASQSSNIRRYKNMPGNFRGSSSGPRRFNDNSFGPREMHKAICSGCKKECEVPFKPTEGREVFCKDCYAKRKGK
jgi:CxxC-x17-CxxC domain-containing protein